MALFQNLSSKHWRSTVILACLTFIVLMLSVPGSLRQAYERNGFYVFSHRFIEDIPKRLTGPGRFRFIMQPLAAIFLGIRSGIADRRAGRPPYLYGLCFNRGHRREMMKSGFAIIANLLFMGILVDSICQWLILGASYPGAAVIVGPVLIVAPYTISRALSNRCAR